MASLLEGSVRGYLLEAPIENFNQPDRNVLFGLRSFGVHDGKDQHALASKERTR